jgi:hypothetical protein
MGFLGISAHSWAVAGSVACGVAGVIALLPVAAVTSPAVAVFGLGTCALGIGTEVVHTFYPDKTKT